MRKLYFPDADGAAGGGGAAAGTDTKTETPAAPEAKYTQAQLDATFKNAMGKGAGKVHEKLGVANDDEAIELVNLGREAKKGAGAKKEEPSGDDIQKRIDAAVGGVRSEFEKQLKAKDDEIARKDAIAQRFAVDNAITHAASKKQAVNPLHVVELLRSRVRLSKDGQVVEVLDERGEPLYDGHGKPLAVDSFVDGWLNANPHFLPAGVKPGAGQGSSAGGDSKGKTITRAEFEKKSQAEKAAILSDPNTTIE